MNPLLIRRRGMMAGDGIVLPPGYTRVPSVYGRRNGAKFIIVQNPSVDVFIFIEAKKDGFVGYAPYFGNYLDEGHNAIRLICQYSDIGFYANLHNKASNVISGNGSCLDWHTFLVKRIGENYETLSMTIDGVERTVAAQSGTSNSNAVYLNARNNAASIGAESTYFKRVLVGHGSVVDNDYIPCVNPSNVAGFYDIIGGVFKTSINNSYPFLVGT